MKLFLVLTNEHIICMTFGNEYRFYSESVHDKRLEREKVILNWASIFCLVFVFICELNRQNPMQAIKDPLFEAHWHVSVYCQNTSSVFIVQSSGVYTRLLLDRPVRQGTSWDVRLERRKCPCLHELGQYPYRWLSDVTVCCLGFVAYSVITTQMWTTFCLTWAEEYTTAPQHYDIYCNLCIRFI